MMAALTETKRRGALSSNAASLASTEGISLGLTWMNWAVQRPWPAQPHQVPQGWNKAAHMLAGHCFLHGLIHWAFL